MIKKATLLFILVAFVICVYGCETVKGACQGASRDWETAKGIGAAAAVMKADEWIRKNLW